MTPNAHVSPTSFHFILAPLPPVTSHMFVCHSKRWRGYPCQNLERWGTAPLSLEQASFNNSSQNYSVATRLNDCSTGRTIEGLAVRYMARAIFVQFCPQNCEKRPLASSCLSVREEHLRSNSTDFYKIWYLSIFRNSVTKIQVSLKSGNNNGYFTWRPIDIFDHNFMFFWPCIMNWLHRVSQEECARLRENVPYVKLYRYNPKHLYPKLNGYGDNGQRILKLWQLLHTYW